MHPSESKAFDRVKSLLGKLDRSIDDARRRRLTEGDEEGAAANGSHVAYPQTHSDRTPESDSLTGAAAPAEVPARSDSKYGRARPIRDLSGPNQAAWQRL
jgi:hypothetical protein